VAQTALAGVWRQAGRYRRAGLLLDFTLASAEAVCGPESVEVAAVCNEWAMLGKYTGHFARSEGLYRRALAVHQARGDLMATASVCHNLGGLAHARGDHAGGEPWARRAVEIRTGLLGGDHPVVAADAAAWAALLEGTGRREKAEDVLGRALVVFESAYGLEHHEVAVATHNLAAMRHRRGDVTAAADGYARALVLKEKLLGDDHPELATTLVNLATAHRQLGRSGDAAGHYTRAVAILTPRVATDHPTLAAARRGLSQIVAADFENATT